MNATEEVVEAALTAAGEDSWIEVEDVQPTTHDYIPYRRPDGYPGGAPCAINNCGASRTHPVHLVRP